MKETGIIMSGDHPKLILDGLKTMTRRTWGLKRINEDPNNWELDKEYQDLNLAFGGSHVHFLCKQPKPGEPYSLRFNCPYGEVGDRLWVRETWDDSTGILLYKADCQPKDHPEEMHWISPLFLSREDSRILLEITEIRVERLQSITEKDLIAEGVDSMPPWAIGVFGYNRFLTFRVFWDSLNTKRGYGWDRNPWVWVIGFKRIE
jgi:hypothetical protein